VFKIREFYEIFKIRKNSYYLIASNCKVFEFAQHQQSITVKQPIYYYYYHHHY